MYIGWRFNKVMGAKGAAEIIFKMEIVKAGNHTLELERREKAYVEKFAYSYIAASRGFINEVIMPNQTREKLIDDDDMLQNKADQLPKKKHGHIPFARIIFLLR